MNTKELFEVDFMHAAERRDYEEMADIYEEMDRGDLYDDDDCTFCYSYSKAWEKKKTGKYNTEITEERLPRQYCFTEILPGNRIKLPAKALNYISHFGSEYIYCLEDDEIKFAAIDKSFGEKYNNLIYEFYEEIGVDTKTVEIIDTIYLDGLAMQTLGFRIGDVVKLWFEDDIFIVSEIQGYSKYINKF